MNSHETISPLKFWPQEQLKLMREEDEATIKDLRAEWVEEAKLDNGVVYKTPSGRYVAYNNGDLTRLE